MAAQPQPGAPAMQFMPGPGMQPGQGPMQAGVPGHQNLTPAQRQAMMAGQMRPNVMGGPPAQMVQGPGVPMSQQGAMNAHAPILNLPQNTPPSSLLSIPPDSWDIRVIKSHKITETLVFLVNKFPQSKANLQQARTYGDLKNAIRASLPQPQVEPIIAMVRL